MFYNILRLYYFNVLLASLPKNTYKAVQLVIGFTPMSTCSCLIQIQGWLQVYDSCNLNEWCKTVLHNEAFSLLLDGTNGQPSPNLLRPSQETEGTETKQKQSLTFSATLNKQRHLLF